VRYRFGSYELADRQLASAGRRVPLAPKPLGVLGELVARPGEIVEKETLTRAVWGDRPVSDESLSRSVFLVRQALGDNDAAQVRYVETVHGRGYRFVADVTRERAVGAVPRPSARPTDPRRRAAQQLCLEAWSVLSRGMPRVPEALAQFERAVATDPAYAPALAGLGEANVRHASSGTVRPRTPIGRARTLLEDAVALAPDDARAHACLAIVYGDFDWDLARAEREIRLALACDPADPVVRWVHGRHLLALGRCAPALDEFDACARLDPSNLQLLIHRAMYAYCAGRNELALERAREVARMEPEHPTTRLVLSMTLSAAGHPGEAAVLARQLLAEAAADPRLGPATGLALACAGDEAAARAQLGLAGQLHADDRFVLPTLAAQLAAQLGERMLALRWLETAVAELCPLLSFAAVYPAFRPLHREPRFRAIVRRIGRMAALGTPVNT
jgi:DNA-binding winged helix-turn-helix (wHTH) protein/cytochrome c-type biogenesis protein CcmH/NrfG